MPRAKVLSRAFEMIPTACARSYVVWVGLCSSAVWDFSHRRHKQSSFRSFTSCGLFVSLFYFNMPKLDIPDDLSVSSNETGSVGYTEEARNEVQEIRRDALLDTRRVNFGRISVACVLLVASVVVTVTTYTFLQAEQEKSFEAAVSARHWCSDSSVRR